MPLERSQTLLQLRKTPVLGPKLLDSLNQRPGVIELGLHDEVDRSIEDFVGLLRQKAREYEPSIAMRRAERDGALENRDPLFSRE